MNKAIITFSAVFLALALSAPATAADVIRLSEPVAVTEDAEIFGSLADDSAKATTLETLLAQPEDYLDTPVRVDARITQVCQKKGCFMVATAAGQAVRISFKDYAFFVPTDTDGKTVSLTGMLVARDLTEEQAAHFRDDAQSDSIQAGKVYEIVADSVSVPRT